MKKLLPLSVAMCAVIPLIAPAQVVMSDQEYVPAGKAIQALPVAPVTVMSDLPIATAGTVAPKSHKRFQLVKGYPIHSQLQAWAKEAGWDLHWYPAVSWKAIGSADMSAHKDVSTAVEEVIEVLRDEGKPIRLRISEGNRVMEVVSNDVRSFAE